MKRTPLKRSRARWSKGTPKAEQEAREVFGASVQGQVCVVCGCTPVFAHHVIEAAELRRQKLPPYDVRNSLALCENCHANHHSTRRVPFRKLRAANIDYAYEVLGPFAADYIRARYPMAEEKR